MRDKKQNSDEEIENASHHKHPKTPFPRNCKRLAHIVIIVNNKKQHKNNKITTSSCHFHRKPYIHTIIYTMWSMIEGGNKRTIVLMVGYPIAFDVINGTKRTFDHNHGHDVHGKSDKAEERADQISPRHS
jgi:hypothetical protein